jgi:signal transduction histidine kinase
MKKMFILLSLSLTFGFTTLSGNQGIQVPRQGVLDLSERVWDDQTILNLNGEWLFHWEKLLTPGDYDQHQTTGIPVTVPSYWSGYKIDGQSLPGSGYGTYSLQVILPRDFHSFICFDIPVFDAAYALFINDQLVSQNGEVGSREKEEKPWYEPKSLCMNVHSDTIHILIQVSNFHHRRGGFWKPVVIGHPNKVLQHKERQRMFNYSTIGVLFFFMIFFLIYWFSTRREITMLLFALTTMGILIRAVNTGLYFSNVIIDTPWSWQIRMEYLGSYLAHLFGMILLHKLFPLPYMKRITQVNTILMALACLSLLILPVRLFSFGMLGYQPLLVLFLAYYLVISLMGAVKGRMMDAIFFVSLSFFLYTLINDILLANSVGSPSSNYLSQISFQLFILAMAVLIIMQWTQNQQERLLLESSLLFKNRVLSVIAHDLKNPIASISQFSELLTVKPELAAKKHVVQSLRESAHAAVTLLDNLLYWGRSESDRLTVDPALIKMDTLVHEAGALYAHMAIQKEIVYTANVEPGITAYADPVFVNIVLRNLVANAIKFTRRGGSVQVRAWQEKDRILCSVIDTGIGLKPEYLEQFKEGGSLSSSTGTDQEIGTGLGLLLVRDLLAKNNGTLEIESKPEVGSSFTFTLPLDKNDRDEDR